jgi:hypothetical protein
MNAIDRMLDRYVRSMVLGPARRRPRERPGTLEPGERRSPPRSRQIVAYVLAVVLPAGIAFVLIPFRDDHGATLAIILVVPVVAIAAVGATGPAVVAALTAGVAYDVFLTAPYQQFVIDDPDDVVTMITLIAVGLFVGVLSSRVVMLTARDATRHLELDHLVAFAQATTGSLDDDELATVAADHLVAVLDLRECRWQPGRQISVGLPGAGWPVLLPDGRVAGDATDVAHDRAVLPPVVELPALVGSAELGRFILSTRPGRITSEEERLTAGTIASLYAARVASSDIGA